MKKIILISSGIVIILLVIGVWVYLFMNGRPDNADEVFTQLGISGGKETNTTFESVASDGDGEEVYEIDNTPMRLKQLTTKPVAGAGFVENGVRYVEQGTGHIYEINFEDSTETLISGTTITQTIEAWFSNNGEYVALTSLTDHGSETIVGKVMNGELTGNTLPPHAKNISLHEDNKVFYTTETTVGSAGYMFDIETEQSSVVFESPLQDIVVLWGSPIYVYTTPSAKSEGFVYRVENGGSHNYVTEGKNGLVALRNASHLIVSASDNSGMGTFILNEGEKTYLTTPVIPEKCVSDSVLQPNIICAVPNVIDLESFPDDWYKGVVSYTDSIVSIDIETGNTTSLIDLLNESGREVDVYKIGKNSGSTKIYMVNKNDNTLWLYDRTVR